MRRDGVRTVTVRALTVELFGDPGHGDQRNGGGDDLELQVAQPGQILQMGISHKVDRHKRDNDLVHGCLLHIAYPIDRRGHGFCKGHLSEMKNASHLDCYAERLLGRKPSRSIRTHFPAAPGGGAGHPSRGVRDNPGSGRVGSPPARRGGRPCPTLGPSGPYADLRSALLMTSSALSAASCNDFLLRCA